MKDKFCISKKFVFGFLILVILLSIFYVVDYVKNQKLSTNSQAAVPQLNGSSDCERNLKLVNTFKPGLTKGTTIIDIQTFCSPVKGYCGKPPLIGNFPSIPSYVKFTSISNSTCQFSSVGIPFKNAVTGYCCVRNNLIFSLTPTTTPIPTKTPIPRRPTSTPRPTPTVFSQPKDNSIYPESIRIIDNTHPITEKQIKDEIFPNLVLISKASKIIRVVNPDKVMLQSVVINNLEQMIADAIKDKVGIFVRSGFRSFEEQAISYSQASNKTTVVKPGYSQHHSGIAIDFTTPEIGNIVNTNSHFENTKAGIWLQKNAYKYGFAQTYTKNHQGIANESWHYFYLGKKLANEWYGCFSGQNPCDVFEVQSRYSK